MNDPEVIMLDALPTSNLIAHRKALEAAAIAISLVSRSWRGNASVPVNLFGRDTWMDRASRIGDVARRSATIGA